MNIDVIILSNATDTRLMNITQQCLNSLHESEKEISFNAVVFEQQPNTVYTGAITVHKPEPFNYNRFMNDGILNTSNNYIALCNNDLIFHKHWASHIIDAMEKYNLLSASPLCPNVQGKKKGAPVEFGYDIAHNISGWCIMTDRLLYDIIGLLDDTFDFWFSDNVYIEQLKLHDVQHALVRNSIVTHLGSTTLNTLEQKLKDDYTINEIRRFVRLYPDTPTGLYFKKYL